MALHEQSVGATSEWYTPAYVFEAMGVRFDLDAASPGADVVPWIPATSCYVRGSLEREWFGLTWLNAPFGGRNGLAPWLQRFFEHGNGVALVPDRTSAPWWQTYAPQADLILFVGKKIRFIAADGKPGNSPAQGTCLFAKGPQGIAALRNAAKNGLGMLAVPGGQSAAATILRRLLDGYGQTIWDADDNLHTWLGGYAGNTTWRQPGEVHLGDVRAALALSGEHGDAMSRNHGHQRGNGSSEPCAGQAQRSDQSPSPKPSHHMDKT